MVIFGTATKDEGDMVLKINWLQDNSNLLRRKTKPRLGIDISFFFQVSSYSSDSAQGGHLTCFYISRVFLVSPLLTTLCNWLDIVVHLRGC